MSKDPAKDYARDILHKLDTATSRDMYQILHLNGNPPLMIVAYGKFDNPEKYAYIGHVKRKEEDFQIYGGRVKGVERYIMVSVREHKSRWQRFIESFG
jgi:hypothetical protein